MKKRLHMLVLLLVAWLVVPWTLSAEEYINENFNTGTSIPDGWDSSEGTASDQWGFWDNSGYDGSGCAVFGRWLPRDTRNVLKTKEFTPETGTQVKFNYSNGMDNPLKVYIVDANGGEVLQVLSETLQTEKSWGVWGSASFVLNDFGGKAVRLAFDATSDYGNYNIYIDDVLIKSPNPCPQPVNLNVLSPGQTSAMLTWEFIGSVTEPTNYKIKVDEVDADGEWVAKVKEESFAIGSSKSYEITGIQPLKRYKVVLTADCSADQKGESDPSESYFFYTASGPLSLPIEEDFMRGFKDANQGMVDRHRLLGWNFAEDTWNVNMQLYEDADEPYDYTKQICLVLRTTKDKAGFVIMPPMAHPINDVQLTLKAKGNKGVQFEVGVVDAVKGSGTMDDFYPFDTITLTSTSWQEYRVNSTLFQDFEDEIGHKLALRVIHPQDAINDDTYVYVDNVEIEDCPTCPRIENVTVMSVDSVSAELRFFTYSPSAGVNVSIDGGAGVDAQVLAPVAVAGAYNEYTVEVKGLTANTDYNLCLRSACGGEDNGEWSIPVSVSTLCGPRGDVVFKQEFTADELPECWFTESNRDNVSWKVGFDDVDKDRFLTTEMSYYNDATTQLYLQSLPIDVAGKYDVSFRYERKEMSEMQGGGMGYGEDVVAKDDQGLRVYVSNKPSLDGATLVDFIPLDYELAPAERLPGWYTYECNLDLAGNVYVIFDANVALNVDDIEVKAAPVCRNPKYIVMGEPTAIDAKMTWRGDKRQSNWSVEHTLTALSGGGAARSDTKSTTTPEFSFTGLTGSTRYRVEGTVTADCGVEKSDAVPFKFDFETTCDDHVVAPNTPFIENFDGDLFVPVCWRQNQKSKGRPAGETDINYRDTAWVRNTEAQYVAEGTGSAMLRAANKGAVTDLISPRIVIPETGNYRLTFSMLRDGRTSTDRLDVYVSDTREVKEGTTPCVFTAYADRTYDLNDKNPREYADGIYKYYVDIADTLRGARHFIFRGTTEGDAIYIDEIVVSEVASCDYIDGTVTFDSIRYDAVRVYVSDETVTDFEVLYGLRGFDIEGDEGKKKLLSTTNPVLDGLTAETEYDVYVRRYCNGSYGEEWTQRVARFMTLSNPYPVALDNEYFDDFESMNIGQSVGNPYIHSYRVLEGAEEVVKTPFEGIGAYLSAQIYPEDGRRFIQTQSGVNTRVLVPMYLKKGSKYEISASVVQDNMDAELVQLQFLYVTSLEKESETLISEVPCKIGQGWSYIHDFFTLGERQEDGVYYVGWNVTVKGPAKIFGMDNFRVREVECVPPTDIEVETITHNGATLSWIGADGEKWNVLVTTEPVVDFENVASDKVSYNKPVTERRVELTSLESNKRYYYYVQSVCGDKPSIWSDVASFMTDCSAQTVPFTEDFEEPEMPDFSCWRVGDGSVERNLSIAYSGDASLLTKDYVALTSPELNISTLSGFVLRGWAYSITDDATFSVGVQPDARDEDGRNEGVALVTVQKAKRWTPFMVSFTNIDEALQAYKYITIKSNVSNLWLDDLSIATEAEGCKQPTQPAEEPAINYTEGSTVQLHWQENGSATSWRVEMRRGGLLSFDTVVDNTTPTIEGLASLTEYEVYVAAICGEEESEMTELGVFRSGCNPLALPYTPKYENNGQVMPDCWEVTADFEIKDDNIYHSAWFANLEYSRFGFMNHYNDLTKGTTTLYTPLFDLTSVQNPQLTLGYLKVAGSGDPQDPAVCRIWILLDGTDEQKMLLREYNELDGQYNWDVAIDLSNYSDKGSVRFAFEAYTGSYSTGDLIVYPGFELYNFTVTGNMACARPDNLQQSGNSTSTASVSFTGNSTSYELVYGNVGVDPNSKDLETIPLSTTTHEISNLTASTSYDVYVRSVCGEERSLWQGPLTVKTARPTSFKLPYAESFETYETADELLPDVSYGETGTVNAKTTVREGSAFASEGNKGLQFQPYQHEYKLLSYRLPDFGVELNTLVLEFDYRQEDQPEAYSPQLVLALVESGFNLSTLRDNDNDGLPDNGGFHELETMKFSKSFVHTKYSFANLPDEYKSGYSIVFFVNQKRGGNTLNLDNIRVYVDESCPKADKPTLIEGSKTMESFSITTSSKADRIQIAYGLAGTAPKNCTIVVVTEEVTPIDGLTEATTYFVFARGVRGENDYSEWSEPLSVTTACGDIVITRDAPYIENFDTYGEMVVPFPPCVNKVTVQDLEGLSYPMLSTVKSVSEPHALLLRGVSMLALPKFVDENGNAIDLSKTVLSFDVVGSTSSGSGSAPFAVGLLDKLGDDATFIDLGERLLLASNESSLTAREDRMHYEVDLTLDDVTGEYFAFRTDATFEPGYVYIDNIEVKLAPTCYEPRALKTTLVMDTALAFEWTAAPDAKRFYYELYQGSMLLDEHKGEVEETNITFKDLLPDYTYTLYVSTICDDAGEEITKSSKIKVQTHRRFGRIPYEYGFEDSDMGDVAADWYRLGATWGEGSGNNPFVIDTKATSSDSKERFGEKSLYVTDMMNSVNTEYGRYAYDGTFWATTSYAYRTFYLEPGKYSISYDWKANGRTIGSEWEDVECGRVFFVSTSYEIKDNEPKKDAVNQNNEGSSFMIPDGAIVLDNGQNLTGQTAWQRMNKVRFDITEAGMYNLVVAWTNTRNEHSDAGKPLAIDNIVLENQDLETPVITSIEVDADSAMFEWTSEHDTFAVRVFDAGLNRILIDTVYQQKEYTVRGLTTASEYTFEVRAQYPYGNRTYISEWADTLFVTECVVATEVPYLETFDKDAENPLCWTADGKWIVKKVGESNRMNLEAKGNAGKAELISPAFIIPDDEKNYHLTFTYFNSTASDALKVKARNYETGEEEEIMTDMMTSPSEDRWIPLDKYAGDTIQFLFVVDVTETEGGQSIWFDDFRIACIASEVKEYPDTECFNDKTQYDDFGFKLTIADIGFVEGETQKLCTFDRIVKAKDDVNCDTIHRLVLMAGRGARTVIDTTICKGWTYVSDAFPDGKSEQGEYESNLLKTTGAQCDSIVVLNLKVREISAEIKKTICEGDSAQFMGVWYHESIELADTTDNGNGCDSVTTFSLTVLPKEFVTEEYISECKPEYKWTVNGETYRWDAAHQDTVIEVVIADENHLGCDSNYVLRLTSLPKERLTRDTVCQSKQPYVFGEVVIANPETKRYEYPKKDVTNCDFTDVLELVVTTPDTTFLTDNICQGRGYKENGFDLPAATKDTVAYLYLESVDKCDSVVKITLDFIETVVVDTVVSVDKEDLPYEFDGRDLVDPGKYTATFESVATGCDSIVNLTLEVTVGVDGVKTMSLTLAPNPIRTGETTYIHRDWTAEEQDGMRVEVINSVGQIMTSEEPDIYPIAVRGIDVSGVYYVRITTGTGEVYIGKIVVK